MPRAPERQAVRAHPLDLERAAPEVRAARARRGRGRRARARDALVAPLLELVGVHALHARVVRLVVRVAHHVVE